MIALAANETLVDDGNLIHVGVLEVQAPPIPVGRVTFALYRCNEEQMFHVDGRHTVTLDAVPADRDLCQECIR